MIFNINKNNIKIIIICLIIICIIVCIITYCINKNKTKIVWTYWENVNRDKYPTHIKLCFDTMKKHLGNKLIIVNDKTIHDYIPNLRKDLNKLNIAQKVDYYRIALLYYYGGIWIDADTIVMKNFDDIFDKLKIYDFVGFGCSSDIKKCFNGINKPCNGFMGSKPYGKLITCCFNKLNETLNVKKDNYGYFDLGKIIIWKCLNELYNFDKSYNYYHYSCEYDGSRDKNGYFVSANEHFDKKTTHLLNIDNTFIIALTGNRILNYPEYKWILDCDEKELLYNSYWISELYRKALQL